MKPPPFVEWSLYCDAKGCGKRILVRCATDAVAKQAIAMIAGLERWSIADAEHRCGEHDATQADETKAAIGGARE